VAGTRSGAGKTTVATGLMAALHRRGRRVASAKVGPDFIDPGYHALATGRPGRNLDIWMSGAAAIAPLAGRAGTGAEILIVEGVMGLFDGAADGTPSSTAEVAKLLDAPVVLVVDAASLSQSVAAMVHGYRTWDPGVEVAGVILNMVASESHERMLRAALEPTGVEVLGALARDDSFSWRSRHLGLQPVAEHPAAVRASLDRLATVILLPPPPGPGRPDPASAPAPPPRPGPGRPTARGRQGHTGVQLLLSGQPGGAHGRRRRGDPI
jgi:cobyrinic acid a,c-diamide synthase